MSNQQREVIELTGRQRERLDKIKSECASIHVPEPSDQEMLSSLLDTWDAAGDGYYVDSGSDE